MQCCRDNGATGVLIGLDRVQLGQPDGTGQHRVRRAITKLEALMAEDHGNTLPFELYTAADSSHN